MIWPTGWGEIDPKRAAAMEAQLARELADDHILAGLPVHALGVGGNGDDVLFEIADGSERVAYVHLTWSSHEQDAQWPYTVIYPTRNEWIQAEIEDAI